MKSDIRKFEEIGTHSSATRLSIGEALLFHEAIGPKRKEERLRFLTTYWMDQIRELPGIVLNTSSDPDQYCAIANFSIDGRDVTKITEYLFAKHKIIATPIVHDEFTGIRITPNLFTTLRELDRFCAVIDGLVRKKFPKELRA